MPKKIAPLTPTANTASTGTQMGDLTPTQHQLMMGKGTIGGTELDQILDNPLNTASKPPVRTVKIFSHDGGTTHPDTWMGDPFNWD